MVDSPVAIFLLMTLDEVPKNVNNIESLARQFDILSRQKERLGTADFCVATDGYFQALGIPLLRGRIFDERDGTQFSACPIAQHSPAHFESKARRGRSRFETSGWSRSCIDSRHISGSRQVRGCHRLLSSYLFSRPQGDSTASPRPLPHDSLRLAMFLSARRFHR